VALLITSEPGKPGIKPTVLDCESYVASEHIDKVGFEHKDNKCESFWRTRFAAWQAL
jgi:hypothetical protein